MTWQNNRAFILCYVKLCVLFQSHQWIQSDFLSPCELEIWRMNRAPLLCYFKLWVSFHGHWSIQTGVIVRKCPSQVKINFFGACHLEIWQMTLKNNRAPLLSYFKLCASFHKNLWIQTGVTVRKRLILVKIFAPCDLEIWRMTLKNNRATLLYHFKLYASFHSCWWIQTGVRVRKRPNWVKIGFDLCDLDIWTLTLTFGMDITLVNGNNSCKFHDDLMTGTLWKRWHRRMDGQTDGQTEVFLELLGHS